MITHIDSNSTIIDGDYPIDLDEMLINNNGSVNLTDQWVSLNYKGHLITITFDLEAHGNIMRDKGDYYTPPSIEVNNKKIKINIVKVESDDNEINYNDASVRHFIKNIFLT